MADLTPLPGGYYRAIHDVEEAHWWHVGMREISAALLGRRLDDEGLRVLDAGCGTGGYLAWLAGRLRAPRLAGFDVSDEAVAFARARVPGAELSVASVADLPYADGSFDLVALNDVLQHVPESEVERSLAGLRRVLAPRGVLIVRTNGARHARRDAPDWRVYDRVALRLELERAGFAVDRLTSANLVLSGWGALRGRVPRIPDERTHGIPRRAGRIATGVGSTMLRAEARYLRRPSRALPFGHTLFAVATLR